MAAFLDVVVCQTKLQLVDLFAGLRITAKTSKIFLSLQASLRLPKRRRLRLKAFRYRSLCEEEFHTGTGHHAAEGADRLRARRDGAPQAGPGAVCATQRSTSDGTTPPKTSPKIPNHKAQADSRQRLSTPHLPTNSDRAAATKPSWPSARPWAGLARVGGSQCA